MNIKKKIKSKKQMTEFNYQLIIDDDKTSANEKSN